MRQFLCGMLLLMLCGCRAPAPTGNWLAPFGSTRVPPRPTGSYGAPDVYYPGPKAAEPARQLGNRDGKPEIDGRRGDQAQDWQLETVSQSADAEAGYGHDKLAETRPELSSSPSPTPSPSLPTSSPVGSVRQASFSDASRTTIRIVEPNARSTSQTLPLKGMHVNDATAYGKPSPFVPSGQLVELPQPLPAERTATALGPVSASSRGAFGTPPAAARQLEPIDASVWKAR